MAIILASFTGGGRKGGRIIATRRFLYIGTLYINLQIISISFISQSF